MLEMLKKMATPFGDWNTLLVAWKQSLPDLERRLMNLYRYSKHIGGKRSGSKRIGDKSKTRNARNTRRRKTRRNI